MPPHRGSNKTPAPSRVSHILQHIKHRTRRHPPPLRHRPEAPTQHRREGIRCPQAPVAAPPRPMAAVTSNSRSDPARPPPVIADRHQSGQHGSDAPAIPTHRPARSTPPTDPLAMRARTADAPAAYNETPAGERDQHRTLARSALSALNAPRAGRPATDAPSRWPDPGIGGRHLTNTSSPRRHARFSPETPANGRIRARPAADSRPPPQPGRRPLATASARSRGRFRRPARSVQRSRYRRHHANTPGATHAGLVGTLTTT